MDENPLTPITIYSALQSAGSNQQLQIQSGTRQLQQWETRPGYYTLLQTVYLDKTLPTEIRYLAIIQLKNGVDKYFRKSAPNAISLEEKKVIRANLLDGAITEPDSQLARQTSLAISKVVRLDWPLEWSEALTDLIAKIRIAASSLHLQRGLLVLLQIVKELSTARLRRSQTSLQSITPELVYLLSTIYLQSVQKWMGLISENGVSEGGIESMEASLYCLKILRRLIIAGYEYPHKDKDVQQIWSQSQQHFGQFLEIISHESLAVAESSTVKTTLKATEKHLFQLAKLHVAMSETHSTSFALLPDSIPLTRAYWSLISKFGESYSSASAASSGINHVARSDTKDEVPVIEKLALKGLNILRACIKMIFRPAPSFRYRSQETKDEEKQAVKFLKDELFTNDLVSQMASTIVTKFFVFRKVDLDVWDEDPDGWEAREEGGGDTWQYEIRPCSERLFMDLVMNFSNLLLQPLLSFFGSVANGSQNDVLVKDSVYTAMGLAAPVVYRDFDFDSFLVSTLVNDIQLEGPGYKVLRRRVAILIAQWSPVKLDKSKKPLVYQIFQHLLNGSDSSNDEVVRITAARQLKVVIDDFAFEAETFLPYISNVLSHVMALIQEIEHTETRMAILDTVRAIATRMELHIVPYADQIVTVLPGLWEASGEEHLMKQAILSLLSTLVAAMKREALRYNSLVLPLIHRAVEPGSEMQVYLLEEALDLWASIVDQTPAPASPEMVALIDCIFPLLEIGSDTLSTVLNILKNYTLLCPALVLGATARLRILSYMTSLLGTTKRDLSGSVTTIVERMIRAAGILGGDDGLAAIGGTMIESGLIGKIMEGLRDAWEARQTTGPNRRVPKLDDVVETDYFTLLARIALGDPKTFFTMMQAARADQGESIEQTWDWISTEWFQQLDSMANIDRQKLSALALTRLLEITPSPSWLLVRLQDYFAMWTTIIDEMNEGRNDGDRGDNLVWTPLERNQYETEADVRSREQSETDPVHTVHTENYVKEKLQKVVAECGGETEFREKYLVNLDRDVLAGFAKTTGISFL